MQEAVQTENDEVEDIEDDDEELVAPSTREVEILKNFSLFSEKRSDPMQDLINKFETFLTRNKAEKCKQAKIASYFEKRKINLHSHTLIFFVFIGSFTQTCLGLLEAFS